MTGLLEIITSRDDYLITLANTASSSILRCLPSSLPESSLEVFLLEFCESMRRKVECHGQLPPPPFVSSVSFPSLPHTSPTIHVSNPQCCCQKNALVHVIGWGNGESGARSNSPISNTESARKIITIYNSVRVFLQHFRGYYKDMTMNLFHMVIFSVNFVIFSPNLTSKSRKFSFPHRL